MERSPKAASPARTSSCVDRASFKKGKFALGDQVTVLSQGGSKQFPLVGVVKFGDADTAAAAPPSRCSTPRRPRRSSASPGMVDAIVAKGDGSVSEDELAQRVQAEMPEGVEVLTGEQITKENQSDIRKSLQFFNILLLVFAARRPLRRLVHHLQHVLDHRGPAPAGERAAAGHRGQPAADPRVADRRVGRDRARGVGPRHRARHPDVEGARVRSWPGSAYRIPSSGLVLLPRTIIVSLIVGVAITVFSAVVPAVRASKVPPVAAMRDVAVDRSGQRPRPARSGAWRSTVLGAVLLGIGLAGSPASAGLGIPLIFIGVFVLGPLIARPVARFLGAPLPRLQGVTGTLARENSMRNPKRTARTAAALMVGVALVAGISVLAASIKSVGPRAIFEKQFTGDFVVSTQSFGFGGLPLDVAEQLNELPEVEAAAGIQLGVAKVDGKDTSSASSTRPVAGKLFDLELRGRLDRATLDRRRASRSARPGPTSDDLAIGSTRARSSSSTARSAT